jgi:hypothetical protein
MAHLKLYQNLFEKWKNVWVGIEHPEIQSLSSSKSAI